MKILLDHDDIKMLHEFFTRTMEKMNVAMSALDAQAIRNWNDSGIMVGKHYQQIMNAEANRKAITDASEAQVRDIILKQNGQQEKGDV